MSTDDYRPHLTAILSPNSFGALGWSSFRRSDLNSDFRGIATSAKGHATDDRSWNRNHATSVS
ncbi:hypothetical protein ZHAS_00019940 [Anopheles sinensis]|uniref:Uncharacterized protein n=1 Tax=Anopheles sinensis TaxID=74873 RepID=A0A084WNJ4_ANOSI|nr:hypothetical protein ZHAS_00019940 [Anopheles sinensis]